MNDAREGRGESIIRGDGLNVRGQAWTVNSMHVHGASLFRDISFDHLAREQEVVI
jgi:hypothetical protein